VREEYERRLALRRQAASRHEALVRRISVWRLLVVVAGAALAWYNYWLLPLPVALFAALLVWHERVARKATLETRAAAWYTRGLQRLNNDWYSSGETGERFREPQHPYADDLDLFGRGSVFQLLNAARTLAGEATLARWLSAPSAAAEVRGRQTAIDVLRDRLDLREDLALLGEDIRAELHAEFLTRWGAAPPMDIRPVHRWTAGALTGAMLASFAAFMFQFWSLAPLLVIVLFILLFFTVVRLRVHAILGAVEMPARDLSILAALLQRFESEPLEAGRLQDLKARIATDGVPASRRIAQLRRLIELRDQARNQMFAIVAEPLLWSVHFAFAIERWRQVSGPHIGDWLEAVGELEALSSLAGYASEHPSDPFPSFVEDGPLFEGEGLAHPLIPESAVVRNDVVLGRDVCLLLVSGSNMSGKSTLLRSVGLNTVLAWAGAPVRARALRLSPLAVGASMRTHDSVLDGKSRFYSEITRLRQIVQLAGGKMPLLYLLDEVLSGTNSHDRLIGAKAVVRTLVQRAAIGLVTTHDLALARIADELGPAAANVHFEDHIEDGRIAFDYRMRPGVVRKSNAIELMRSVGLEV
jgi:hypothetical protein